MGLDINIIRHDKGGNPDVIRDSLRKRFQDTSIVDEIILQDQQWRKCRFALDQLNKEFGIANKQVAEKKKASKGQDPCVQEIEKVTQIKLQIKQAEQDEKDSNDKLQVMMGKVSNLVHESVPVGQSEEESKLIKKWGNYGDEPNDSENRDFERGQKVSGEKNFFLLGEGVIKKFNLISQSIIFFSSKGYSMIQTPLFIKQEYQFNQDNAFQVYHKKKAKFLISSSEQALSAMFYGEWIDDKILPMKFINMTTCFDNKIQYDLMNQFIISDGTNSWKIFDQMLSDAEELLIQLNIAFQVKIVASGCLNKFVAKEYQIDGWNQAEKKFEKMVSICHFTDYTSRSLEIRAGIKKPETNYIKEGKKYVNIMNASWNVVNIINKF